MAAVNGDSSKPSSNHARILVFETDEPHPDTKERRGSFGNIFHEVFTEAGQKHDPPLSVDTDVHYIVEDPENGHHGSVPKLSDISTDVSAILITGSMYDAHGNDDWIQRLIQLLRDIWIQRPEIKFSGVCFGHQVLARTLGASVESTPDGAWELAHTEMNLTSVGRKLFRTDKPTLALHQMHQDQVTTVPSATTTDLLDKTTKVHVWASTEHTQIQGLYIRDRLFTTQGHLDLDKDMVHQEIEMREESGGIDGDEKKKAAEAKETAHMKHDGLVVASAVLRFFHGDDHDID